MPHSFNIKDTKSSVEITNITPAKISKVIANRNHMGKNMVENHPHDKYPRALSTINNIHATATTSIFLLII